MTRRLYFLLVITSLLGLALSSCGQGEVEAPSSEVIVAPDVLPTDAPVVATLMPTPTLAEELLPTEPPVENTEAAAESADEEPTVEPTLDVFEEDVTEEAVAEQEVTEESGDSSTPEAATEEPTAEPTAEPTPGAPPDANINGMPVSEFVLFSPAARENVRAIFLQGRAIGRNPNTFSILGDSLIATQQSLAQWDKGDFVLGDYAYLQPTIDYYAGSFGRYGPSVRVGLHSWSVSDPLWADKEVCLANENVLDCEIRLNNPSVMLVFLGSNDSAPPGGFKMNYDQVINTLINNGIVPILATKADRFEGPDNANNMAIREVAETYQLPLLEFDLLANTLPGRGLSPDNVHLTYLEPVDYSSPGVLSTGYPVHNLAVLMALDEVRRDISGSE